MLIQRSTFHASRLTRRFYLFLALVVFILFGHLVSPAAYLQSKHCLALSHCLLRIYYMAKWHKKRNHKSTNGKNNRFSLKRLLIDFNKPVTPSNVFLDLFTLFKPLYIHSAWDSNGVLVNPKTGHWIKVSSYNHIQPFVRSFQNVFPGDSVRFRQQH